MLNYLSSVHTKIHPSRERGQVLDTQNTSLRTRPGPSVAMGWAMAATHADVVKRDFLEMPGLELTPAEAVRLWNLGPAEGADLLDALVASGFLRRTPSGTVVRAAGPQGSVRRPR